MTLAAVLRRVGSALAPREGGRHDVGGWARHARWAAYGSPAPAAAWLVAPADESWSQAPSVGQEPSRGLDVDYPMAQEPPRRGIRL